MADSLSSQLIFYREASDQKFNRKDGDTANQLMKAIAVAVSNLVQWFTAHLSRSLPIRTVIPADAHAAANVSVDVIYTKRQFSSIRWHEKQIKLPANMES